MNNGDIQTPIKVVARIRGVQEPRTMPDGTIASDEASMRRRAAAAAAQPCITVASNKKRLMIQTTNSVSPPGSANSSFSSRHVRSGSSSTVNSSFSGAFVNTTTATTVAGGNPTVPPRTFDFDAVYECTNAELFEDCVRKELVEAVSRGINYTVFAYGQTGSGKTHTVYGSDARDPGVAQRALEAIFERLNSKDDYIVTVSHLEIYNEKVRDLLASAGTAESGTGELRVREHPKRGPFVEGLSQVRVETLGEALSTLESGLKARTVGETAANERSSRSHAIFQVDVTMTTLTGNNLSSSSKVIPSKLTSRICIVDLAGSERSSATIPGSSSSTTTITTGGKSSSSSTTGVRMREACAINTSLMTLRLVVTALSANASCPTPGSEEHVPYRNSVLTWLLRDSLGGSAKTTMIATISNDKRDVDESISTLRYAERAKQITNHVVVNEDPTSVMIRALRGEIETLKSQLQQTQQQPHSRASGPEEQKEEHNLSASEATRRLKGEKNVEAMSREQLIAKVGELTTKLAEAERDSKERAELLWSSAESLREQMNEAIKTARMETEIALHKQEEDEILPLVEECSALRIQCAWGRYQRRKTARELREKELFFLKTRAKLENELSHMKRDNAAFKIQAMRHLRDKRELNKESTKAQEQVKRALENASQAQREAKKATGDLAVVERAYQIQNAKRLEAEKKAEREEKERIRLLTELSSLQSAMAVTERRVAEEAAQRAQAATLVEDLSSKVELLQREITSFQGKQREDKMNELRNLENELKTAREGAEEERRRGAEAAMKMEELRREMKEKEKSLALAQKELERKREEAEEEAAMLRARVGELEKAKVDSKESDELRMKELEELNRDLKERDLESRRLLERETNALRERIKTLEASAVEEMERLNREVRKKEAEAAARAVRETRALREKVATLEKQIAETQAVSAEERKAVERKAIELEQLNAELEEREKEERERKKREFESMKSSVTRLERELETVKATTAREVHEREVKLKELERLNLALAEAVSQGAHNTSNSNSRNNASNTSAHNASNGANETSVLKTNEFANQIENLLAMRVDVESFDVGTNAFHKVESNASATPNASDVEHVFSIKAPAFDLNRSKWSRFSISFFPDSRHRVEEISNVRLEHVRGAATKPRFHALRIIKCERDEKGTAGVIHAVADWDPGEREACVRRNDHDDSATTTRCFCFDRDVDFQPPTSGPMVLKAVLKVSKIITNGNNNNNAANASPATISTCIEYPLQFRAARETVLSKLPRYLQSTITHSKVDDETRHPYLNSLWYQIPNVSLSTAVANPPLREGKKAVQFSGYLLKRQSHVNGRISRWFVFAPPFLLCYPDAKTAALDFSKSRAVPQRANRALIVTKSTRISVNNANSDSKSEENSERSGNALQHHHQRGASSSSAAAALSTGTNATIGFEQIEFAVINEEKTWFLQAANSKDLEAWVNVLGAFVRRERGGFNHSNNNGNASFDKSSAASHPPRGEIEAMKRRTLATSTTTSGAPHHVRNTSNLSQNSASNYQQQHNVSSVLMSEIRNARKPQQAGGGVRRSERW